MFEKLGVCPGSGTRGGGGVHLGVCGPVLQILNRFQTKISNFPGPFYRPGARFSKVPVTSGPDNLSGPLSGNFIGPGVAFLEAPVNFPGNFRAR